MSGLSKDVTVLVAIFAFLLIAFTAQLVYVLWWRRRFRHRSTTASEFDAFSSRGGDWEAVPPTPPSKELLYFFFFCLENNQFRIKPATAPPLPPPPDAAFAVAVEPPNDDVALKCSPASKALSAIEEKETFLADGDPESLDRTIEVEGNEIAPPVDQNGAVEPCDDYSDEDATPYYTPPASPVRDGVPVTSV